MGHALAQVRLMRNNGLSEDAVVNTFHFDTAADPVDVARSTNIADRLEAFYKTGPTAGGNALSAYLSSLLSTTGHQIKVYDQGSPIPRAPIYTRTWDFPAALGNASAKPAEVAVCLSYTGGVLSGVNMRRRRGRIYLGPLNISHEIEEGDLRPSLASRTQLLVIAAQLRDTAGPLWSIYSTVNDSLSPVVTLHVDNAFDTQRRRGAKPTSRLRNPA